MSSTSASFIPRSKHTYKRTLPLIINTSALAKVLFLLQLSSYLFVLLVGISYGNENYNLTPKKENIPAAVVEASYRHDNIDSSISGNRNGKDSSSLNDLDIKIDVEKLNPAIQVNKRDTNINTDLSKDSNINNNNQKSATGQSQFLYSPFEIINANYPFKSFYYILIALTSALKFYFLAVVSILVLRLFRYTTYQRMHVYSYAFVASSVCKFGNWLIFNYVTLEDSPSVQGRGFLVFLMLANLGYYLVIFKIFSKNILLFNTLMKSSNFNNSALTFNKVFNNYKNNTILRIFAKLTMGRKLDYFQFLKLNYAIYVGIQCWLFRSYYYHQIANDLTYLNVYNFLTWLVLLYDLVFDSLVLDLFGLGSGFNFNCLFKIRSNRNGKIIDGESKGKNNNGREETLSIVITDKDDKSTLVL